jgi:hypothetical protein
MFLPRSDQEKRSVMEAYFRYASGNKLAIKDLTNAIKVTDANFGPTHAEILRRPVAPTPGTGAPRGAHGASFR